MHGTHQELFFPTELYLFKYNRQCPSCNRAAQQPTDRVKKLVFVETSMAEISRWVQPKPGGEIRFPELEELVIIDRRWEVAEEEFLGYEPPRYMVLPTLKTLKIAGYLPDICLMLDFLEVENLRHVDMTIYGVDTAASNAFFQMLSEFKSRCSSLASPNIILHPLVPREYAFPEEVFTTLPIQLVPHMEYV